MHGVVQSSTVFLTQHIREADGHEASALNLFAALPGLDIEDYQTPQYHLYCPPTYLESQPVEPPPQPLQPVARVRRHNILQRLLNRICVWLRIERQLHIQRPSFATMPSRSMIAQTPTTRMATYSERWRNYIKHNTIQVGVLRTLFPPLRDNVEDDLIFTRTPTERCDATTISLQRGEPITLENLAEMTSTRLLIFVLRITPEGNMILVPYRKISLHNYFLLCNKTKPAKDPVAGSAGPLLEHSPAKSRYTLKGRTERNHRHILLSHSLISEIIGSRVAEEVSATS